MNTDGARIGMGRDWSDAFQRRDEDGFVWFSLGPPRDNLDAGLARLTAKIKAQHCHSSVAIAGG